MTTPDNIPTDLISGRLRGGNSKLENSLLERWLAREGNAAIYNEIEKLWNAIRLRAGEDRFDEKAAWEEVLSTIRADETASRIRGLRIRLGLTGAVAAAALACLAAVFVTGQSGATVPPASEPARFATMDSKSTLTLPDGSHITLYPQSEISCSPDFNIEDRTTELRGRAYFSVAHDTERPFYIDVDGLRVRVVGTAFDLDARSDEVILNVTEGKVCLSSEAVPDGISVSAGRRAVFDKEDGGISVSEADVETAAVWASGKITFDKDNLGTVCRGLSDWYGLNIIPSDRLMSKGSLSFTVTDESVDVILSIISKTSGISYRHEGNNTIIIY